jgi:ribonuclease P protein component
VARATGGGCGAPSAPRPTTGGWPAPRRDPGTSRAVAEPRGVTRLDGSRVLPVGRLARLLWVRAVRRLCQRAPRRGAGVQATWASARTEEAMREAHLPAQQPPPGQAPRLPSPHVGPGRASHPEGPPPQGPQAAVGLIWRARRRRDFDSVRDGRRRRVGVLTVTWGADSRPVPPRVAFAIGKKVGSAVRRNRIRRQLRAIVHQQAVNLRRGVYLIGVSPGTSETTFAELSSMFARALDHIHATDAPSSAPPGEVVARSTIAGPRP